MGMELAALALVNVVTALAMYFFFSIRFSRAVRQTIEESRKNSLLRELKENVELTIEYINSSLDTMDQKTRSFYQLLRRSEELVETLSELQAAAVATAAAPAKKKTAARKTDGSKKTARKKAASAATKPGARKKTGSAAPAKRKAERGTYADDIAAASAGTAELEPALSEPALFAAGAQDDSEPAAETETNYNVDRVLADVGADRLEISPPAGSVESAYRSGELSRREATGLAAGTTGSGGGLFQRVGQVALKILGIDSLPDAGAAVSDASAPAGAAAPPPRQRFEIPDLPPERQPGESGLLPRLPDAEQARRRAPEREQRPEPAADRPDYFDRGSDQPPASTAGDEFARTGAAGRRNPGAAYGPAFSMQPELPPPAEVLRAEGLVGRSEAGEAGRREVIRTLLRYGYRPADIARATGIALPQVELVASLPDGGPRPRRQRLTNPEA